MAELEPRISYAVARLERAIRQGINQRVKPYGLTTLQYTTLSVLGRRDGLSNAQLARRAYMTPQSMNEVIDALERKGLIVRNPHPNHRRVYPASLTAKGREVLGECDRAVDELESQMLSDLTARQADALRVGVMSAVRSLAAGFPRS
jgi:DNA-binding MarR family transcriptional regulator